MQPISLFAAGKPARVADAAVERLLELVHGGSLALGSRLPLERELVGLLGCSRMSLREAIRILETMGVLRIVPGKGTWVREDYIQPSLGYGLSWLPGHRDDVMLLFELKETLEKKAAGLAAERASVEQILEMAGLVERLAGAVSMDDLDAMVEADGAFHAAVAGMSGNHYLVEVLESVERVVSAVRRSLVEIPGRPARILAEHRAVAAAIIARDGAGAAEAMTRHCRHAEEEISEYVRSIEQQRS